MIACPVDTGFSQVTPEELLPQIKRSGGPRTPEGKENSRRNALKRGLRSRIVFPSDMSELVEARTQDFLAEFAPQSPYEEGLVRKMAVASARHERCQSLQVPDMIRVADRAAWCWELDRKLSVETLAARLSQDPRRVVWGLRKSAQGTTWLIEHWELLGRAAREAGGWDDAQRQFAFDLMGVPAAFRGLTVLEEGDDAESLVELVESYLEGLRNDEEVLYDLSEANRAMTMAGMPLEEDPATARLRKDEARARNDLSQARTELLRSREAKAAATSSPGPDLPTHDDRPPLSEAALDNLSTRATTHHFVWPELAFNTPDEVTPEPVETPKAPPRTRRARKELARRAREAARREAATR